VSGVADVDGRSRASSSTPVLLVNNSAETFTPTHSGAIATCLHELMKVASAQPFDHMVHLVTNGHEAAPYAHQNVHLLDLRSGRSSLLRRARRRLTGWAHDGQSRYYRDVVRVARQISPRVLVCNNDPELAVMLHHAFPEARVIHWFHNLLVPSDRFRRRFAQSPGIESVAVSDYLARGVEQILQLRPRSVRTVYNGVDAARFVPASPTTTGEPVTIGFLGRVCVEKGPDTLLRAAMLLSGRGAQLPPFRIQMAGDTNWGFSSPGRYRDEVGHLVAQLRSRGVEVVMPGHVEREQVPAMLGRTHIHVVPSRWDEPFGLTLLEGMSCGLAVVAAASGGLPEVLGGAGELFTREDPEALAEVLSRLITAPGRIQQLGADARSRAAAFTWDRTYDGLFRDRPEESCR
jgi:glycosyltransferase involved in cell wall biosynthesis